MYTPADNLCRRRGGGLRGAATGARAGPQDPEPSTDHVRSPPRPDVVRQSRSMDDGLTWLGLSRDEARVLRSVVELQEISSTDLVALLGSSRPAISRAVGALTQRGLVESTHHRRPALVRVHPEAPRALQRLREEAEGRDELRAGDLAEVQGQICEAARSRADRGRPFYERSARVWQVWHESRVGTRGHDEVHIQGAPRRIGRRGRLLVTTHTDLHAVAQQQMPGTEVRRSDEALPRLLILDRERVAVQASDAQGVGTFWTQDQRHVRAAQELFDLWWQRAGTGVVRTSDYPESPLDEWEEWQGLDPDDPLHRPDGSQEAHSPPPGSPPGTT